MKKHSSVKYAFLFTLFVLLTAFAPAAFAAAPDAAVKGLWLTCPGFPADAEEIEFTNDMDIVTYKRGLDGLLTFKIRRQPLAGSELQKPADVAGLIEMRVNNDDISEEAKEANFDSINVDTDAKNFTQMYSYPSATAEYTTGANEDMTDNASLFIFTNDYCFEVTVTIAADYTGEYRTRSWDWFAGLKFVNIN
jgi:hypothetical protein